MGVAVRTLSIALSYGLGLALALVLIGEPHTPTSPAAAASHPAASALDAPFPLLFTWTCSPPWDPNNGWLSEVNAPPAGARAPWSP